MGLEERKFAGKTYYFDHDQKYTGMVQIFYGETELLKMVGFYLEGLKTGEWYSFYENGNTKKIETYAFGELNGILITFYENNQTKEIGMMRHDKMEDIWYTYYETGILHYENHFKNGEQSHGIWKEYAQDGKLVKECPVMFGKLNGELKVYNQNGDLIRTCYMKDDEKNGIEVYYGENGEKLEEIKYIHGERQ